MVLDMKQNRQCVYKRENIGGILFTIFYLFIETE